MPIPTLRSFATYLSLIALVACSTDDGNDAAGTPDSSVGVDSSLDGSRSDAGCPADCGQDAAAIRDASDSGSSPSDGGTEAGSDGAPPCSPPLIGSVQGAVGEGSTITIVGSCFGDVGPNVALFEDFELGTAGSAVSTTPGSARIGHWTGTNGSGLTTYTTQWAHGGSMAEQNNWDTPDPEPGNQMSLAFPSTHAVFVSHWVMIPFGKCIPGSATCGNPIGPNWKMCWIFNSPFGNPHTDDYVTEAIIQNSLGTGYTQWGFSNTSGIIRAFESNDRMSYGQWSRSDWYQKAGVGNGRLQGWITNATAGHVQALDQTGTTLEAGYSWNELTIPGYGRGQTPNGLTLYDDIYVATGAGARARVEIGDAPTYASCTNLAISTASSWTGGAIHATVRLGSFQSGDPVYVYVIDPDGNVNAAGYPATVQ